MGAQCEIRAAWTDGMADVREGERAREGERGREKEREKEGSRGI